MTEVNLIGGFYKSKSLPFSAQDLVNWLPVSSKTDQSRSPIKLRGLPGLSPISTEVVSALQILGDAPNGTVGTPYSYAYSVSGGDPPYSVFLSSGTLPDGLSMSSAGVISGTPTTVQIRNFNVSASDSAEQTDSLGDTIQIVSGPIGWRYVADLFIEALGVAYGGGRWVSAGVGGITSTGVDDLIFVGRTSPFSTYLDVCFGAGTFVASAGTNSVATSTDGVTWVSRAAQTANGFLAIIYNGTRFIKTGFFSQTEYSSDGISWTRQDRPGSATSRNLAFKPSSGVVISANDNGTIHRTTNSGGSWSVSTITGDPAAGNPIESAVWFNSKFYGFRFRNPFIDVFESSDDGATFSVSSLSIGTSSEPRAAVASYASPDGYIVMGGTATGLVDISDFNIMKSSAPTTPWTQMGSSGVIPANGQSFRAYVCGAVGSTNEAMIVSRVDGSCAFLIRDSGSA